MSRWTLGNVVKVAAVVALLPLLAYLVLVIGGVQKRLAVILEGLLYAAAFSTAVFVLDFWGPPVLLALAAMGVSGVRSWHLRDLWLPKRRRWWKRDPVPASTAVVPDDDARPAPVEGADHLPSALAWVRMHATRHQHRLPAAARVTVRQTCQVLDAVIAAEQLDPTTDPRFAYELGALVRQYLPAVLKNYLAIAPGRVEERQPNGRTPNEELTEQLRLLSGQADTLYTSRHRRLTAELSTTGNFLRDKFGTPEHRAFDAG